MCTVGEQELVSSSSSATPLCSRFEPTSERH